MKVEEMTDHDHIRLNLLPEVAAHMRKGEDHYGANNHNELGLPGQYADIWRKIKPLKRALWDDDSTGMKEGPREICLDLIGHCLLTIAMIDRQERAQYADGPPIITGPSTGPDAEKLKAAGWYEENGCWHAPLPARIDRDIGADGHSYLTDASGVRRCSSCKTVMMPGQKCTCDNAA